MVQAVRELVPEEQESKAEKEVLVSHRRKQLRQEVRQLPGEVQDRAAQVLAGKASQAGGLSCYLVLGETEAVHPVLSPVEVGTVACPRRGNRVAVASCV